MRKSSLKHETQLELIKCKSSSRGQEADELSHIRGRITQSNRSFFIFILKVWAVTQNSVGKQNSQLQLIKVQTEFRWSCFQINNSCKRTFPGADIWNLV